MRLPSADDLITLHQQSIELFGGAPGISDQGALEASLARAEHLLAYADPPTDAIAVASAVCVSICRNHAFVDGNKRIAFIALGVILELNGHYLDARESKAEELMMGLAGGTVAEDQFAAWVRANTLSQPTENGGND